MEVLAPILGIIALALLALFFLWLWQLGLIGRVGLRRVALIAAAVISLLFAYHIADALNPLLIALLIAYALNPLVSGLERRGFPRKIVVAGLTFAVVATVALGLAYVTSRTVESLDALRSQVAGFVYRDLDGDRLFDEGEPIIRDPPAGLTVVEEDAPLPEEAGTEGVGTPDPRGAHVRHRGLFSTARQSATAIGAAHPDIMDMLREKLRSSAEPILTGFLDGLGWVWTEVVAPFYHAVITYFILIPIYLFFFLLRFDAIVRAAQDHLPGRHRERIVRLAAEIDEATAAFFRSRALIGLGQAVLFGIGFSLAGVPFALVVALIGGVMSFVPVVGAVVPLVLALVLAWGLGWGAVAWVVVTVVIVKILDDILSPFLLTGEHGLHPVTYIVSLLVAGEMFGLFGVILSVPITCAAKILAKEFVLPEIRALAAERPAVVDGGTGAH